MRCRIPTVIQHPPMATRASDPGDEIGPDDTCTQRCQRCGTRVFHADEPEVDVAEGTDWPWECLNCGTTIFHDGECCVPCRSTYYSSPYTDGVTDSTGFFEWIRRESLPSFVLKTTGIAGIEIGLTAFWLLVFISDPFALGQVASLAV